MRKGLLITQLSSLLTRGAMAQQPDEPVRQYFACVRQLQTDMRAAGMPSEEQLMQAALMGLQPSFQTAADAARYNVLPSIGSDLTALEFHFLQVEQSQQMTGQIAPTLPPLAHLAAPAPRTRSSNAAAQRPAGQRSEPSTSSSSNGSGRAWPGCDGELDPNMKCWECERMGHKKKACPLLEALRVYEDAQKQGVNARAMLAAPELQQPMPGGGQWFASW